MRIPDQTNHRSAFSLVEVLIATLVVALTVLACAGGLYAARVQDAKNRDQAIVNDFANHYFELIRGIAFNDLKPGVALNGLYDGTHGAPLILIPSTNAWTSIDTSAYATFDPDLIWLTNRSPALSLSISTNLTPSGTGTKVVSLVVRWMPPLSNGSTQFFRGTMLRVPDA